MAQTVNLWGATYSDVPAIDVPSTGNTTVTFTDVSDTTATADKILVGYGAFGSDGTWMDGTATGGGGSVTQDQDGYIVLPSTGGGGGVEYTATITHRGFSSSAYVIHDNTKYYAVNDSFTFSAGDTLSVYVTNAYSTSIIIDGVTVASEYQDNTYTTATYDYTLPQSNIEINIQAENNQARSITITSTVAVNGVQESTGTVNGSGGTTLQISCSFAPNLIYIYGDMSGSVSNRGIVSVTILKDSEIIITSDGSTSSANETLFHYDHSITDYGIVSEPHATYSNGLLTVDVITDSSSSRFNSSITYNYKLVGWS